MMSDEYKLTTSADNDMRTQRMNSKISGEQQIKKASHSDNSLTSCLMEQICKPANLNQAYKRVKANKGAPGADGITIDELRNYIATHKDKMIQSLLDGSYRPQAVRLVEIPKPDGGVRQLGIPTAVDRLVQQAILQVLQPIFEKGFSDSSFGFRPKRSAHQAVKKAQEHVREGHRVVVDMDLEKFFDRVNHDILMAKLAVRINDKRLLKIIRSFLKAGIMRGGVGIERIEGMPQGGPLSPLLSNILLDELDQELERRGHKFCRYADDCNIYVKSQRAGERVLESLKHFLGEKLRLKGKVTSRQFLGFRLLSNGKISLSNKSKERVKDGIRALTKRSRGVSFSKVIEELNVKLRGWINYFKLTESHSKLEELDCWIRRKLRCYRLKQRGKCKSLSNFLMGLGVPEENARKTASSGKGWWRLANAPALKQAMSNAWFDKQGLINLRKQAMLVTV